MKLLHTLAAVLMATACGDPAVPVFPYLHEGDDVLARIHEQGYKVIVRKRIRTAGRTNCVTRTISIREDSVGEERLLAHEYVHALQADYLGCTAFLLGPLGLLELEAYVQTYVFTGCDPKEAIRWKAVMSQMTHASVDPVLVDERLVPEACDE